mgnify:CR=1 FL=1
MAPLDLVEMMPPQDVEAEQAVLGSVLMVPDLMDTAADMLQPDDFYRTAHGTIFRAMLDLWRAGHPVDLVAVNGKLNDRQESEATGGPVYLMELPRFVTAPGAITYHAKRVRLMAEHRAVIKLGATAIEQASAGDLEDPLGWMAAEAMALSDRGRGGELVRIGDAAQRVKAAKDEAKRAAWANETPPGRVLTGLPSLDDLSGGFETGELIVLAARPGVGKSALAAQIAANVARRGEPVLCVSLEMPEDQITRRLASSWSGVDSRAVRDGLIDGEQERSFDEALQMLGELPLYFDATGSATPATVASRARKVKAREGGLGLVVVDYLQLMTLDREERRGRSSMTRNDEVALISRHLRSLALALGCPVLALSQLSREIEKRNGGGGRPQLSDLRDSGAVEQDASVIWFLYRGAAPDEFGGRLPVNVDQAKHRSGCIGRTGLDFEGSITRFHDRLEQDVWHGDQVMPRWQTTQTHVAATNPEDSTAEPSGVQVMLEIGEDDDG